MKKKENLDVYSEKLGKTMTISEAFGENGNTEKESGSSMVGWTHNGWNNDNGGAGW